MHGYKAFTGFSQFLCALLSPLLCSNNLVYMRSMYFVMFQESSPGKERIT